MYFELIPTHYVKNQDTQQILLQGKIKDVFIFSLCFGVHLLTLLIIHLVTTRPKFNLWPSRFRHSSFHNVKPILNQCNIQFSKHNLFFDSCAKSKSHQLPFMSSTTTVYTAPLQLLYIDVRGPSPVCLMVRGTIFCFWILILNIFGFSYCILNHKWLLRLCVLIFFFEKPNWSQTFKYSN